MAMVIMAMTTNTRTQIHIHIYTHIYTCTHTHTQVRTPDHPWPKPLTPSELAHWLDVLGNYTDKGAAQKAAPAEDVCVRQFSIYRRVCTKRSTDESFTGFILHPPRPPTYAFPSIRSPSFPPANTHDSPRQSVDNPLQDFAAAASGPVNIKEWVGQGKCKHADLYLAQILDRLQPWSNGGISRGMIENAARKGEERSNFGGLHYQIVDGNVYARSEGNNYWVEFYAGLFANTLRSVACIHTCMYVKRGGTGSRPCLRRFSTSDTHAPPSA